MFWFEVYVTLSFRMVPHKYFMLSINQQASWSQFLHSVFFIVAEVVVLESQMNLLCVSTKFCFHPAGKWIPNQLCSAKWLQSLALHFYHLVQTFVPWISLPTVPRDIISQRCIGFPQCVFKSLFQSLLQASSSGSIGFIHLLFEFSIRFSVSEKCICLFRVRWGLLLSPSEYISLLRLISVASLT